MTPTIATKTKTQVTWDTACDVLLKRREDGHGQFMPIDRGVNFFVLALEALGATTHFSCEGHPSGFYITFDAPYSLALQIKSCGFFSVEIEGVKYWSLRLTSSENGHESEGGWTEGTKTQCLRWAAEAWMKRWNFACKSTDLRLGFKHKTL